MKQLAWDRPTAIAHVRDDVWRYLNESCREEADVVLAAAALLQLPERDVRTLAQIQFSLSDAVGRLLEQMPRLVRRLATTTVTEREAAQGRIRGPVQWGETYARRRGGGAPRAYVTAPALRAFATPENRLLAFALAATVAQGRRTGWQETAGQELGVRVAARVAEATRWLQLTELTGLSRGVPGPAEVAAVRAGRNRHRYATVLEVCELHRAFVQRLDRGAVRRAVEQHALVASRDHVLLELRCAFDTIAALRRSGWDAPPDRLLAGAGRRIFRGRRGGESVEVYYQHTPPALAVGSRYGALLRAHSIPHVRPLRPDLVLRHEHPGGVRWLLIEVKSSAASPASTARATARDLLMYRREFGAALDGQDGVFGIGYAWGEALAPVAGEDIVLCTPDTLPLALAVAGVG